MKGAKVFQEICIIITTLLYKRIYEKLSGQFLGLIMMSH
jgi:hypothetical protein